MNKLKFRDRNDLENREFYSRSHRTSFSHLIPSTSQSERENCDLNVLVRRFGLAPVMATQRVPPTYGEWDQNLNLHGAVAVLQDARASFNRLPAKVRERFNNDPLELLAAIKDPDRREELELLGIFKAEPVQPRQQEAAPADPPSPSATEPKPAATK